MIYLYIILGMLLALIVAILFVPIRINIEYQSKKLYIELEVLKCKFDYNKLTGNKKRLRKRIKKYILGEIETGDMDEQLTVIQKLNIIYKNIVSLKKVYTDSSKTINSGILTENIEADIYFGFSDAAVTGIVTGLVWSLLYEFLGLISILTTVQNHKFNVDAVYDKFVFEPRISANLKTKIFSLLKILISLSYNLEKYKE